MFNLKVQLEQRFDAFVCHSIKKGLHEHDKQKLSGQSLFIAVVFTVNCYTVSKCTMQTTNQWHNCLFFTIGLELVSFLIRFHESNCTQIRRIKGGARKIRYWNQFKFIYLWASHNNSFTVQQFSSQKMSKASNSRTLCTPVYRSLK